MRIVSESEEQGVRKLVLSVPSAGEPVPAVLRLPAGADTARPVVLLGHGAGLHKEAPSVARLAHRLAATVGYATVCIDLPLHGDRTPVAEQGLSTQERRDLIGLDGWRARNSSVTPQAVADWRATLDAVRELPGVGDGPVGYSGLSMGTRFGIPLVAAESRIVTAVFGLFGHSEDRPAEFAAAARSVTVPLLFLLQWDDRLIPREDGFRLFDLLGSTDKAMHAHPGDHTDLPRTAGRAMVAFLREHLGEPAMATPPAR